ncbi:MAG TPA: response regulator [Wenzhouxiangella sp.]|nr:response regulator [Wenzhouxiangella sp.]
MNNATRKQKISPFCKGWEMLPDLTGKRILIVGDQPECRDLLYETVVLWGGECHEAENVARALERARELAAQPGGLDLVLIDLNACGAQGLAAARKMAAEGDLADAHILFLNGEPCPSAEAGRQARAFCVEKPLKVVDLQEAIAQALCGGDVRFPRRAKQHPPTGLAHRPRRILLVEDNPVNARATRTVLEKRGHQVVTAENGRQALRILADQCFDLILMDIVMPEMDGTTATRMIRAGACPACDPAVPIVALTTHVDPQDRHGFMEAGVDDFLAKPFQVPDLLAIVENIGPEEG